MEITFDRQPCGFGVESSAWHLGRVSSCKHTHTHIHTVSHTHSYKLTYTDAHTYVCVVDKLELGKWLTYLPLDNLAVG